MDMVVADDLSQLGSMARRVGTEVLDANAASVDANAQWPAENMQALAKAGLLGLHVPKRLGGHGQGMLALSMICEELARHCGSTAMCYGMHCVATQALVAKATPEHESRYLQPIARGEHLMSLALSEPGTGSHFYLPRSHFRADEDEFVLSGVKGFVTSGGYADSYVVSLTSPGAENDPGSFTLVLVEGTSEGLRWGEAWRGYGMRGNSSRSVNLEHVRVPAMNLLGAKGDQIWYMFEIVLPYFLTAMAGVYLGLAAASLELAIEHLKTREHQHTGETLSAQPVLWHDVASAWTEVEATRRLAHHAARLADAGDPGAVQALLATKAKVAKTVNQVTDIAMALLGGRGYGENSAVARMHRDARAAQVMSPTTHLVEAWLGRSLLGLPLL
ncbi:MAG TPA: acyl-CoA dehydrogenase family protein [Rhodanobacteraceae bacterium]|nr:acyl-CoA dehydrogenase family protein [Rhodanobacteraceae bacterium]